jgi:hypothetical protein
MNKPYFDLHRIEEDERIQTIGKVVTRSGKSAAVFVDDIPGKPERYTQKLLASFPNLKIEQLPGPTPGSVMLNVSAPPPTGADGEGEGRG